MLTDFDAKLSVGSMYRLHLLAVGVELIGPQQVYYSLPPLALAILRQISQTELSANELIEKCRDKAPEYEIIFEISRLYDCDVLTLLEGCKPMPPLETLLVGLELERNKCLAVLHSNRIGLFIFEQVVPKVAIGSIVTAFESAVDVWQIPASIINNANTLDIRRFSGELAIVVCASLDAPELESIAMAFRDRQLKVVFWQIASPQSFGPVFNADKAGPCFSCLAFRAQRNSVFRIERIEESQRKGLFPRALSVDVSLINVASQMLIRLIAKSWIGAGDLLSAHLLYSINESNLGFEAQHVFRRPQCLRCGDPKLDLEDVKRLSDSISNADPSPFGGTNPLLSIRDLLPYVGRISGAIRSLHEVPGGKYEGIYNYYARHFYPERPGDRGVLFSKGYSSSSGKGPKAELAMAGAICEAFERCSTFYSGHEALLTATYVDVRDCAIDPPSILLYSDRQYEARSSRDICAIEEYVPERFAQSVPIDWIKGWSASNQREILVPAAHVLFGAPQRQDASFFVADSNGCASGATYEAAALTGLLEVVERDAAAIWWYNMTQAREIIPQGCDYWDITSEALASHERAVWLLDITTDLGIPVVVCISSARRSGNEQIAFGFGCDLDVRRAVQKAVAEHNQFIPVIAPNEKSSTKLKSNLSPALQRWLTTASLEQNRFLRPLKVNAWNVTFDRFISERSIGKELRESIHRVSQKNLEVVFVNLSRPDLPTKCVKAIVPKLRHFWRRLAEGRLYQTPVAMGILTRPRPEEEMNPWTIFF